MIVSAIMIVCCGLCVMAVVVMVAAEVLSALQMLKVPAKPGILPHLPRTAQTLP